MSGRFALLVLLALALTLAGLGHYYSLFLRTYIWDAVLFYGLAALLFVWVWHRASRMSEHSWAVVRCTVRALGTAVRKLLFTGPNRLVVVALALANSLAVLAVVVSPRPVALLLVLPLWVASVALLGLLLVRSRHASRESELPKKRAIRSEAVGAPSSRDPATVSPSAVSLEIPEADVGSREITLALGGWLLLVSGLVILNLDGVPSVLRALNAWLEPQLTGLRADLPVPPGVWLPGYLLTLTGMILIGWAGAGVARLSGLPSLTLPTSFPTSPARRSYRWHGLALIGGVIWLGVVYASVVSSSSWSVIPLWLVALIIPAVCWWRMDRARGVSILPVRVRRSSWLIVPVLVVAFSVTLYRLADIPNSLWGDEGAFWTLARDLAQGVRVNPFDLGVYGAFPVISSLFQSLWIKILGPTLWSWRLASVVMGTLTVVPLFFLTRRLLGSRVAVSAVVVMVSMPYFLAYARIGFNTIQPLLPITLGLWLLIEAARLDSRLVAYLAGAALGIASLTYMSGHVGMVIAALIGVFIFVSHRSLRRPLVGLVPYLVTGWILAAGPFGLGCLLGGKACGSKVAESYFGNAFYGEAVFSLDRITRHYPLHQVGQHRIFFEPALYLLLLGRGFIRTTMSLVIDGVATQHYVAGSLAGPGALFFLAGFGWLVSRLRRLPAALWVVWAATCAVLLSALNTFPPRTAHMAPIIPASSAITAVGIWLLVDFLRPLLRSQWVDSIGIGLTVALALLGLRTYFVVMPQRYVPNLENVMFWTAREMEPGSDLLFVADGSTSSEFRVWGIDEFELDVDYHSLSVEELHTADLRPLCGSNCRVFFLPQNAEVVRNELRAQLGEGRVRPHLDAEGRVIGLEFAPS